MEGVVNQWKEEEEEEEEAEVEEVSLLRRQTHEQVVTSTATTITSITTSCIDIQGQEISETKYDFNGIEKKNITPLENVTGESEKGQEISETRDNFSFSEVEKMNITLPSFDPVISRQEISETKDNFSEAERKNITSPFSDPVISRVLTSLDNVTIEREKRQEIPEIKDNPSFNDTEKKNITSPSSDLVIPRDVTPLYNVTIESERAGIITENIQLVKELYLESIYQKTPAQGFYCPNCRSCIQKVLILDTVRQEPDAPAQPPPFDRFRCPTCFSVLILLGSWVFPCWMRDKEDPSYRAIEIPEDEQGPEGSSIKRGGDLASASAIATLKKPPAEVSKTPAQQKPVEVVVHDDASADPSYRAIEIPEDEQGPEGSSIKRGGDLASASAIATLKKPPAEVSKTPAQQKPVEVVVHDDASAEPIGSTTSAPAITTGAVQEPGSSKTWDILKSFVYGGLIESIASLSIVTSSASADATTLSILSLSLANVIGGLFVLVHHIWDLKSEQQSTNEHVDRYYLSLGKRENFYLHVCIAILSFIIFGFVPPLVYGLTLYETNEKDLTLVAVAGASVICITLLSITKTYIQRPNTYLSYLKTVIYYLSTGALTAIIAYLAGVLIRKLLEKLGFSSESSLGFNLMQPEMSFIVKPRFGSY
ncbi:hypothetical protein K1719_032789 [Acacia pycnantha]|nr:hypothetical protein K1719_032789 [Acacia pycnantha]